VGSGTGSTTGLVSMELGGGRMKIVQVLGDVEGVLVDLLEPYGFGLDDDGVMISCHKPLKISKLVWVDGDMVKIWWMDNRVVGLHWESLDVDLSDPGSLDFIEGWARGVE